MILPGELVRLAYTPDLTQAGILYVCRELAFRRFPPEGLRREQLLQRIAGIAADLAFRRYLLEQGIRFQILDTTPFSQPGRGEVLLDGHGVHVINRVLRTRAMGNAIDDSGSILQAFAGLPPSELASDRLAVHDLLVFAFTSTLPGLGSAETRRLLKSKPPLCLIHVLPEVSKTHGRTIGSPSPTRDITDRQPMRLCIQCHHSLDIEVSGLGLEGDYLSEEMRLLPDTPAFTVESFRSITTLVTREHPRRPLVVSQPVTGASLHIPPNQWMDLWLEGKEILLAGYLPVGEFRRRARRARLPVEELDPIRNFALYISRF